MIVIVGAGIGGLITAVILSKFFKKRVCVLEAHTCLGGCLHMFTERDYQFDVGLHYMGGMESKFGGFISSLANVKWAKLIGAHDVLILPDGESVSFGDKAMQQSMLSKLFSVEFASRYLDTVGRCQRSMKMYYVDEWRENGYQKLLLERCKDIVKHGFPKPLVDAVVQR
jgi:phytoene dehydrogenase-like protein